MRKFSTQTFYSNSSSSSSVAYQTSSRTQITRTIIKSDGTTRTITEESSKCPWSKCCDKSNSKSTPRSQSQTNSEAPTFVLNEVPKIVIGEPEPPGLDFEKRCLEEHNRLRANHKCPPLELDRDMCKFAAEWARNIADQNAMQHRPNNKFGENIYWASGKEVTARDAVGSWYEEIKHYNFNRGGFAMNTGHFTQVIWKSSRKLGVGVERRGASTWIVANYDPPGNYNGQYNENVPRCVMY